MKRREILGLAAVCVVSGALAWQPAKVPGVANGPMLTEWGAKVTPENAWREYPRPQMVRSTWTNLNGLWQYAVTTDAPTVPSAWDGEILVPFPIESPLSGVGRLLEPKETLWYRRTFDADVKKGERLVLNFEECDFRTQVFVNGREAGVPHEGGQMPFAYDVTDLVKKGANELVVSVWDPTTDFIGSHGKQTFRPHGCMYTRTSGIGGTVWLETVPATHIAGYKVTPDIDAGTVRFEFNVAGGFSRPEVCVNVLERDKSRPSRCVASATTKDGIAVVKMPAGFKLWSPESPALYDFVAKCGDDEIKGYFGMRKFEKRKDPNGVLRFYFNNAPRFIIGTLDQGWWPDGLLTPPSDEAMAYDIRALKEAGFDMMRKHIKVEPRRYYWLCDTLGIIVLQDMPSGFSDTTKRYGFYRRELKEMIDHLYNVPSIVMWVPYNEGWGQPGQFLTHSTLVWTQRYDPTRLVDGPSGANDWEGGALWCVKPHRDTSHLPADLEEAADSVDKHDYGRAPRMFPVNARRVSFLGEFGGIGCRVGDHLWTTNAWGYGGTGGDTDRAAVQQKFVTLMEHVAGLARRGLGGSVYTQTTDVEGEINGLMTYDRKVKKFDPAAIAAVHAKVREAAALGLVPYEEKTVFPKLAKGPKTWAWTTAEPPAGWQEAAFDDSAWGRSAGGFGNKAIARDHGAQVSTEWNTGTIWLRRHFTLDAMPANLLSATFEMFHDEDAELWLNGKLLVSAKGYTTGYAAFPVSAERFAAAAKQGDNVLAVKVIQTIGGQYIDVGLSVDVRK